MYSTLRILIFCGLFVPEAGNAHNCIDRRPAQALRTTYVIFRSINRAYLPKIESRGHHMMDRGFRECRCVSCD